MGNDYRCRLSTQYCHKKVNFLESVIKLHLPTKIILIYLITRLVGPNATNNTIHVT